MADAPPLHAAAPAARSGYPTPEELGDSVGAIFRDLASAVAGGGDWLSLLELESSTDLETLLRSSDTSLLEEELESAGGVVSCLRRRIDALRDEAGRAERDAAEFKGGSPRRGAMGATPIAATGPTRAAAQQRLSSHRARGPS